MADLAIIWIRAIECKANYLKGRRGGRELIIYFHVRDPTQTRSKIQNITFF